MIISIIIQINKNKQILKYMTKESGENNSNKTEITNGNTKYENYDNIV